MAILKDLIVHGSSRFLNKIYASEIQTPLIEAEAGIFKKLKADDATVVGLLDVKGQLHTNSWSNSNIATIDGSFYITPTIESDSGTVTITATSLNFSGTNYAVTSLYLGDSSSITWPQYSKVLVTGQILSNGEWIPLGTLLGQLSAQAAAASIKINNIKDNKNQTSNVLATLVSNGTTSSNYRNLKVSLYQRASSSTAFYPLGIYMTATGTNGRTFLDIYGGVEALSASNNYGGLAEPNVRIGNLQGLPNVGGQTPSGWGIYTDNGYFKGIIAADRGYIGSGSKYWVIANEEDGSNAENSRSYIYNGKVSYNDTTNDGVYLGTDGIGLGKGCFYVTKAGSLHANLGYIGGWNIGSNSLTIGSWGTDNSAMLCTGTGGSKSIGGSESINNWVFTAGKNFGVTKSGALYASSANISGKVVATSGSIGGVNIVDGNLDVSSISIGSLKGGKSLSSNNLLKDVYASSLTKENAPWDRYLSDASNTTITGQFIAETNLPDPNATHFYRITDSSASTKGRGLCFYSSGTPPFIDGHTYRIGCWVRKHAGSPKVFITLGSIGSLTPTQRIVDNTEWEWIEIVRTFGDTDPDVTARTDTYKRLYFYFYNNNVAGSSLDMCGFKMEEIQVNSGTARNFLLGTEKLTNWRVYTGATISNGIAIFPLVSSNSWREIGPAKNFKYDLIRNQHSIFSIKVKADSGKKCCINLCIGVVETETTDVRQKYFNQYVYFTGDGEWHTICTSAFITDDLFVSGSGSPNYDDCWVTVRIGAVYTYHNGFQAKEPQLCLGTTATSWSRAPEDVDETINNIEIGGRNLIRNTAMMPTTKVNGYNFRASGGTVTHVDLDNSPINGITGAIRITNKGSSTARIGMAQDSLKNCFIVGEKYTMSCWVRASTALEIIFQMIWASDERTTKSSYTILGYNFNVGTDWTYLKWEGATLLGTQVSQYSSGYVYGLNVPVNGWIEVCGLKVEKGNKATAWTPAPEDIEASAVTEEQYIYIQATSGTNSVNLTTTWVTENGESTISDTQGLMPVWTTKRPTYRTNYPVIFIAKQKKTIDGTVTCTTPIKDDTLTIIDGGHITTGTIDASKVTVTNIDASKITTGTLKAERINTKSISIGDFKDGDDYAKTEDVNTAIDNIEVGGRNLLKESDCLAPIQTSKGITLTYNGNGWFNVNGTVTGTSAGILCFYGSSQYTSNISGSGEYTLSIETNGTIFLPSNKTFIQLAYHSDNATNNTIAGDFKILSGSTKVTFTIPENNHISRVCLFIQANATDSVVDGNIRLKLEKGNKATDWTPAPEDVINEAVNKVEVGGRNLIRNSTNFNKWVVQNGGAEGEIWHRSLSGKTSNANARPRTWIGTGYLTDYYNKTLTISFEIMSPDWSAIEEGSSNTGLNGLAIQLETVNGIPYSSLIGDTGRYFFKRLGDKNYFKTDSDLVDGKWVKITSVPLKIDDTLWSNSTTLIDGYDYFTFSFILRRNGTISFRKPKIELGNKATDWTPAPEDTQENINSVSTVANTALSQSSWYATCPTPGGTTEKVATITPTTTAFTLTAGATVNVKFDAKNTGAVGSITLNVNGTGAKNIKYINNNAISNIPGTDYIAAGRTYQFVYDGTYWVIQNLNYNTNTNTIGTLGAVKLIAGTNASNASATTVYRYTLIMKKTIGNNPTWVSLVTSSSNGTSKTRYTGGLYPDKIFYMSSNVSSSPYGYNTGASTGDSYAALGFDLRYSTNCGSTLVIGKPVYLVGEINSLDGLFYLDPTWWTQTEPTIEDGKTYIYLGNAYSTTNVYLVEKNPLMRYYRGAFRTEEQIAGMTATSYITYINANDGIKVHNESDTLNYLQLNSTAISMYRNRGDGINSDEVLRIDDTGIRVGREEKPHFSITSEKLIGYGNNSNIYFEVGKGDDANIQMFYGVYGDETSFEIGPIVKNIEYVKKEGVLLTEGTDYEINATSTFYDILFDTNPSLNSTITVNYQSLYHSDTYSVGSSSTTNVEISTGYYVSTNYLSTQVVIKPKKSYRAANIKIKKSGKDYWQDTTDYTVDQEVVGVHLNVVPSQGSKICMERFIDNTYKTYLLGISNGQPGVGGDTFYFSSATPTTVPECSFGPGEVVFRVNDSGYDGVPLDYTPYKDYYMYTFRYDEVKSGDQVKLQYLVSQNTSLTPDTIVENYTWDSSLQKLGYLSIVQTNQTNQILSVAVNNNILTLNEDYTLEGPLKYDYLILSQPLAIGEKVEIRFTTRAYNSQYNSTYFNFSNKNVEDSIKGINVASFGIENINKGAFSLVQGVSNTAAGYAVHVEGYDNIATGSHSHAEGERTKALGLNSHTSGYNTIVTGTNSYAGGYNTIAASSNQYVIGRFNIKDTNNQYAFIVGNGFSEEARSNAFAITWNGGIEIDNLNVRQLTVNARRPFLIIRKAYTRTITADSSCYIWQNYTSPTGYIPVGIIDWGIYKGIRADYCVIGHAYIWRGTPNSIDLYIWNQHTSESAVNVEIDIDILCIADTLV